MLPSLSDLLRRYLHRQAALHNAGLAADDSTGEVVPFEAVTVQPVDARLAWDEAVAVVGCFTPDFDTKAWQVPPDWAALVTAHEPAMAVAFCVGNFPQLVQSLQPLLQAKHLSELQPTAGRPLPVFGPAEWARQLGQRHDYPQILLAAGLLRLAQEFDQAAELIESYQQEVPTEWQAAWANEQAALAWHQGLAEKAAELWKAQAPTIPVQFNRGMAALFLDQPAEGRPLLTRALRGLAEDDAWHHLGRLYLALAEMRD